jgi:superfamily II DNA or RNA helicase
MTRNAISITIFAAFTTASAALAQSPSFDPESLTCGEYRQMDSAARIDALRQVDLSANEGMATEGIDSPDLQAEIETACTASPDAPLMEVLITLTSE